jgi:hypothetical protein
MPAAFTIGPGVQTRNSVALTGRGVSASTLEIDIGNGDKWQPLFSIPISISGVCESAARP